MFQENLNAGKYVAPFLDCLWKIGGFIIPFISDVDGVYTYGTSLPLKCFEHLFTKEKYARHSRHIEEYERRIDQSGDGRPFEGISRCFLKARLTWDDFKEACELAGKETPVTPYTYEAVADLCNDEKPPSITLGFNSASFEESLTSFSQNKRLPVSMIEGSWLGFHKGRYNGKHFFNYGIKKFGTGYKMLARLNCAPNLRVSRMKTEVMSLSDTRRPDIYFREFVGLGGISLWADKTVQRGMLATDESGILEMNIPEVLEDMRILAYPIKHIYRTMIITLKNSPPELSSASKSVKSLINFGQECLKLRDEEQFNERAREFTKSSQEVLALLSKLDFPRYSTGIDFKYLDLLSGEDIQKRKETLSDILDVYIQNFPEHSLEIIS